MKRTSLWAWAVTAACGLGLAAAGLSMATPSAAKDKEAGCGGCCEKLATVETALKDEDKVPTTKPTTNPATRPADKKPVNKLCPVMDEAIDLKITYEYKGKVYGLCCESCIDEFKADPEKFAKKAG